MSGVNSPTAPIILACKQSTFASKSGKYTLFLTNSRKLKSSDVKCCSRSGHDVAPLALSTDLVNALKHGSISACYVCKSHRTVILINKKKISMFGYVSVYLAFIYNLLINVYILSKLWSFFFFEKLCVRMGTQCCGSPQHFSRPW